jgi:2-amino-1-hydroxyethylphosphonate dioxygenase (glycine-forming)
MEKTEAFKVANEIIDLYKKYGNEDYVGEPVSQLEHMCQCAQLAEKENYDDEVILAAFFHDIGHLCEHIMKVDHMDNYGVVDHEKIGAEYLAGKGFSKRLTKLIASHVEAKRYLTFKNPRYFDQLSEASKITLSFQGGRMDAEEAGRFERNEYFTLFLTLRTWDEQAKEEYVPLPDLEKYKSMMIKQLTNNKSI